MLIRDSFAAALDRAKADLKGVHTEVITEYEQLRQELAAILTRAEITKARTLIRELRAIEDCCKFFGDEPGKYKDEIANLDAALSAVAAYVREVRS